MAQTKYKTIGIKYLGNPIWGEKEYHRNLVEITVFFSVFFLLFLIIWHINFQQFQLTQRSHEEAMIGALVLEHKELEEEIAQILTSKTYRENEKVPQIYGMDAQHVGRSVLLKYGYEERIPLRDNTLFSMKSPLWIQIIGLIFVTAVLAFIWNFIGYNRVYKSFCEISDYLEAFHRGEYNYQSQEGWMREGIQSRLMEQLTQLGTSFGILKDRMVEEKENTKAFVTNISHQLKTPLASLKMSLDIAGEEGFTWEERTEFLKYGVEEVQKLEYLLSALTNLSRLEADMIHLHAIDASIHKTLLEAVNDIYMKAIDKQIDIELEPFEDMIIRHDPKWTREAIVNVLDNGVKYSQAGTHIKIRVNGQFSMLLIEIEDEGVGISKEDYINIFKRFYRGEASKNVKIEGSGVGLYLSRKILEDQHGSIRVKSSYKHGSIFQIMLPKTNYSL